MTPWSMEGMVIGETGDLPFDPYNTETEMFGQWIPAPRSVDEYVARTKLCAHCGRILPLVSFNQSINSPLGVEARCKDCRRGRGPGAQFHPEPHARQRVEAAVRLMQAHERERMLAPRQEES